MPEKNDAIVQKKKKKQKKKNIFKCILLNEN